MTGDGIVSNVLISDILLLTVCYAKKFGPRGIGHGGGWSIGLTSDVNDDRYLSLPHILPSTPEPICIFIYCVNSKSVFTKQEVTAISCNNYANDFQLVKKV